MPIDTMVQICGIDRKTAHRWHTGQQPIGKVALRLLNLYAQGRVIPNTPDWRAWRFFGERLTWDRSTHRFTGAELRAAWQYLRDLEATQWQLQQAHQYIGYLEALIPRAKVTTLEGMRPSSVPAQPNPYFGPEQPATVAAERAEAAQALATQRTRRRGKA